ncbi:GntR family transcriptional regulator [Brachybacterium sp. DNPG3]
MDTLSAGVPLPTLQPLRRPSVIDQAEIELRGAIFTGSLRPGDPVPEVHVSSQMGISRSSLREACQRLVRDGLLTQHPGRGLFVTEMDAATMSDFLLYRIGIEMQTASIVAERVAELRAEAGGGSSASEADGAAASAASDASDAALPPAAEALIAPLRECLERMRTALAQGEVIEAGTADLDLHLRLAEAAGNRFLTSAMNTIVILTRLGSFSDPRGFGVRPDLPETHAELVAALAAGDASRARALLREDLGSLAARLRKGPDREELVRDPELLETPDPEWPEIGGA